LSLNEQSYETQVDPRKDVGNVRVGSPLRSMLSVSDVAQEMDAVLQLAIEMEAENVGKS
jgi:hypothetical protein